MRWALVTGATGTVGRACAESLAAVGLGVIVAGRNARAAEEVAEAISRGGGTALSIALNLSNVDEVESGLAGLAARDIVPTVVVNSAGEFGPLGPALLIPRGEWERLVDVNLLAVIRLSSLVVPRMVDRGGGRFIHVSTAAALASPGTGNAPYSVTKAAANRFLGHLAADIADTAVTVHALHPGEIRSRMWQHIKDSSVGVAGLEGYAEWALSTEAAADPVARVGECVASLLDDAVARRAHGKFLWAQHPGRLEPLA